MELLSQPSVNLIIIVCWALFLIYWLATGLFTKKTVWKQSWSDRGRQTIFLVMGALLLMNKGNLRILPDSVIMWTYSPVIGALAVILSVIGLITLIWSRTTLGRNWSGRVVLKEGHELVTNGPYSLVRHPIYTGISFLALGTAINNGRILSFIGMAFLVTGFLIRAYQEEALMKKQFPEAYPEYMKRTKRLIPWVW